jgi:hypothetical protein
VVVLVLFMSYTMVYNQLCHLCQSLLLQCWYRCVKSLILTVFVKVRSNGTFRVGTVVLMHRLRGAYQYNSAKYIRMGHTSIILLNTFACLRTLHKLSRNCWRRQGSQKQPQFFRKIVHKLMQCNLTLTTSKDFIIPLYIASILNRLGN